VGRRLPSWLRDGEPVAEGPADEEALAVGEADGEGEEVGVRVKVGAGVGVGVATGVVALNGKKPAVAATPK
jgi:hypothetical protein